MSVYVMGRVLQVGPKDIAARMVMVVLADCADDFGYAWPSREALAAKSTLCPATVTRQLKTLEADGWIAVRRKAHDGGRRSVYFINTVRLGVQVAAGATKNPHHRAMEAAGPIVFGEPPAAPPPSSWREAIREAAGGAAGSKNAAATEPQPEVCEAMPGGTESPGEEEKPGGTESPGEAARSLSSECQVTLTTVPGDFDDDMIRNNHHEPSWEPPWKSLVRGKRAPDARDVVCKGMIERYWTEANPEFDLPWSGAEAKHLAELLKANPRLGVDGFCRLLQHRARSEVNHADPPRLWLATLPKYARGPLNRFGKPLELSHERWKSKTESSVDAMRTALAAIREDGADRQETGQVWSAEGRAVGGGGLPGLR